jgi:hypothetical protein
MKLSNEQLYQNWIDSIIENNISKMRENAEDNDHYKGWINSMSWEIDFEVDQTVITDEGSYDTEPSSCAFGRIYGMLSIYKADDEISQTHIFTRDFEDK